MEELLKNMTGKTLDVSFGNTAVVRGKAVDVADGILSLDDEDGNRVFIAIAKIAFCLEAKDTDKKPGFLKV